MYEYMWAKRAESDVGRAEAVRTADATQRQVRKVAEEILNNFLGCPGWPRRTWSSSSAKKVFKSKLEKYKSLFKSFFTCFLLCYSH
jgi:hypothetical protein